MSLPNPQMTADAQAVIVFTQSVTQAIGKFATAEDSTTPEYKESVAYYKQNAPKWRAAIEKLEAELV